MENLKKISAIAAVCGIISLSCVSAFSPNVGAVTEDSPGTAMLIGSLKGSTGTYAQWASDSSATYPVRSGSQIQQVSADGTYDVSFSVASGEYGAVTSIDYLCLQIEGVTKTTNPGINVVINSVSVDGTPIANYVTGSSSIDYDYYSNGKGYTRVYFCVGQGWGIQPVSDIDSNMTVSDNISVNFTLSGVGGTQAATEGNTSGEQLTNSTNETANIMQQDTQVTTAEQSASGAGDSVIGNQTTGDAGVAGAVAGGVIAVLLAALSFKKRK